MPRFGIGESINFWTDYLWRYSTDNELADLQDRICQLIGANFEEREEDLTPDYQETLIGTIKVWISTFKRKYREYYNFLCRFRIITQIEDAISYYENSLLNTTLSYNSFNQLTENSSIGPSVRVTYDIAYCILELCDSFSPDWESIHLTTRESRQIYQSVIQAVRRIDRHNIYIRDPATTE